MKLTHLNMNYILWGKLMNSHSAEIIQLTGDINFARLQQAITIAVNKQPVLRCCIKRKLLRYYWQPLPADTPIVIERCDYRGLSDDELKAKIASHTWCRQADYQTERLVRFYLIDTGNNLHYLQSVSHHAAADAQSGFILFKDIAKIYTALTNGSTVDDAEHKIDNRDVGRVYLNKLPFSTRVRIFCRGIKAFLTKPDFAVSGLALPEPQTDAMRSIYTDALPAELLPQLKAAAKHYNTSVHVLFVLAMIKFKQQFNGADDKRGFQLLDVLTLRQFAAETPYLAEAQSLIRDHTEFLANRDFRSLMRVTKLKEDELREVMRLIHSLNPRPGADVIREEQQYVIPDVSVIKVKGRWQVELNPDAMPKVRINQQYAAMSRTAKSSADTQFIRSHLQEAKWFLKSLESRNETLLKVANCIVQQQQAFFEHGEEAMKPMVLNDVAEMVGMHESTISRVTTQKYMHTPRGIFELKFFFSSHVSTENGGECSSTAIRAFIKKLVAAENPAKPLSDSKMADILMEQGINVARRTIAKYRESLYIPPSNQRKTLL